MISASVGINSSLLLEPAQTLAFALDDTAPPTASVTACLTLSNISPRKHVVFKVRTTNVNMFMVKPAQGAIEPGGNVPVVITLLADSTQRLLGLPAAERDAIIERFLIQSIDRSDDMRGFSIDDLSAFWKRIPKELITNKKLTCRFVEAQDVDAVRLALQRIRLHSEEKPVRQHPPLRPRVSSSGSQQNSRLSSALSRESGERRRSSISSSHDNQTPYYYQQQPQTPRSPPRGYSYGSAPSSPARAPSRSDNYGYNSDHSSGSGGLEAVDYMPRQSRASSKDSYATRLSGSEIVYEERIPTDDNREFRLHPSESLTFPVRHTARTAASPNGRMEGRSYFFITNRAFYMGLAFKIKTTNHTGYFVKPAVGLIGANSAMRVDVFVNAPDASQFDVGERERKDKFLVELMFVTAATYHDLTPLKEEERRQELQALWNAKTNGIDRRQAVLSCQILEEDATIDPSQQTAEQARAFLHKSQAATSLSFKNLPISRGDSGETANPYVHPPPPPPLLEPRVVQYYQQNQHQHLRSPERQQQQRSPVHRPPSPVHNQRSPMRPPQSPVHQRRSAAHQPRSPVHHHHHQHQRSPLMVNGHASPARKSYQPQQDDSDSDTDTFYV